MRFSNIVSVITLTASVASAVLHSGRNLKHVGKADKLRKIQQRAAPVKTHDRRGATRYLTESTASKSSFNETFSESHRLLDKQSIP